MTLVIKAKLLIDGTGAPPVPGGMVMVDGDRISAVGRLEASAVPADATVIDCGGETVLPGLIDSHTHVGFNTRRGEDLYTQAAAGPARLAMRAVDNLRSDIESGVTTMRALGEPWPIDLAVRDAIESGELPGRPRILASARPLRPSHGTAGPIGYRVDGPEGLRRAVRENIAMGADVLKLFVSNISFGDTYRAYRQGDLTRIPAYTRDEIAVVVEEAHRSGLKVAAHGIGGPAMRWALEVGVDSIEHANLIEERDIEWFTRSGAWLSDPNLQMFLDPEKGTDTRPDNRALPAWWREKVALSREQTESVLPRAVKAGVKIALGTDCNHANLWREVACLSELGIDPMDAIVAATRSCAELCGVADRVGTLEKGKLADVVSVKGDPLRDIRALRNVGLVMKGGAVVCRRV